MYTTLFIFLVQELYFQFIVSHFEVRDKPVYDVLKSDVTNDCFKRFSPKINIATRTFCSLHVFCKKMVYAALAESAHALVDGVGISVDTLAEEACQILQHVGFGWLVSSLIYFVG